MKQLVRFLGVGFLFLFLFSCNPGQDRVSEKECKQTKDILQVDSVRADMNLNIVSNDAQLDETWTWWNYPQAITTNKYSCSLIWGWTGQLYTSGVSQINLDVNRRVKNVLKRKNGEIDDHNAAAVLEMNDGKILAAYSGGHNTDNHLHLRVSDFKGNIKSFGPVQTIDCGARVTYAQLFFIHGKYRVFTRIGNKNWGYIESADGREWSAPHIFLKGGMQYYIKLVQVTDKPDMLRMCMYSNPTSKDAQIRMGFLDFSNDQILQSDGTTRICGLSEEYAVKDKFNILLPLPDAASGDDSQRMLDVAESDMADTKIAFARFNTKDVNHASKYYVYDNGKIIKLLDNGEAFWHNKYQGGISFISSTRLVLSRNRNNKDYIEIWSKENSWTKVTDVFSEETSNSKRNVRPIVDTSKRYILWQRGYYDPKSYVNFVMNTMIYDMDKGQILR